MIDRTDAPETNSSASSAATRRAFRSKVDSIRPTYGFEDVSLAPGTDTIEPADVDLAQVFCGIELEIPILASAMDAVVDTRLAGELARPRRAGGAQHRRVSRPGSTIPTRSSPDRDRARRRGPRHPRRGLPAAHPRGPDRRRIEAIHAAGSKAAVAATPARGPAVRAILRRARRGPVPRPEPGVLGTPHRHRVRPALARRVHPLHAHPGRGREHDERRGGVLADGAGRGGRVRGRRAGRRVHHARGARHRRAAGHGDQRRGRGARRLLRRHGRAMCRSSPMAGCVAAASSPRPSPRAPTR